MEDALYNLINSKIWQKGTREPLEERSFVLSKTFSDQRQNVAAYRFLHLYGR